MMRNRYARRAIERRERSQKQELGEKPERRPGLGLAVITIVVLVLVITGRVLRALNLPHGRGIVIEVPLFIAVVAVMIVVLLGVIVLLGRQQGKQHK